MRAFDRVLLEIKHPKELIYKGINYSMWYIAYSMPILYQRDYGELLESVDITMSEVVSYNRKMHSILGRMPFEELMKQNPIYAFKNTYGPNPFRQIILWANEVGYEYDHYYKNVIKDYVDNAGNLDIPKLNENYKINLEKNYIKVFNDFWNRQMEEFDIYNTLENDSLLKSFNKSYKVHVNKRYCVVLNRIFEENQISELNEIMLLNSYMYTDKYRIDEYKKKLSTSPEKYFNSLNYSGEFNKANFAYACIDNFEKTIEYDKAIVDVTIRGKNYILESLCRLEDKRQIKEYCDKTFVFMESVENRAERIQYMYAYKEQYNVTYEEVMQYRKEMNNEIIN